MCLRYLQRQWALKRDMYLISPIMCGQKFTLRGRANGRTVIHVKRVRFGSSSSLILHPSLTLSLFFSLSLSAYNTPLIYEVGWGKQLSFVFSFGTHQVVDTTRRYARKQEVYIRRRGTVDEEGLVMVKMGKIREINGSANPPPLSLSQIIKSLNSKHQAHLSSTARQQLLALEIAEEQDLKELFATKMASVDDFKTRQSGSLEWRSLRGEMGNTGNGGGGGGGTGSLSFADFSSSVPVFSCLFDKHQDLCLNGSAQLQQPPPSPLTSQDQLQQQRSVILEITPAANDQRGSVFLRNYKLGIVSSSSSSSADHQQELFLKCLDNNNTTITNSSSFSFEFIFRMTNAQGVSANGNGADGMAFVVK